MDTAVRWIIVLLLVLHGLAHLLGVVREPGAARATLWLTSAALVLGTAVMVAVGAPRWWWAVAVAAAVTSQVAVVSSWSDTKSGTAVNVVLALVAAYGFVSLGPPSLAAGFDRAADAALASSRPASGVVTEADLQRLPDLVAAYVRRWGAVGEPHVTGFRAEIHGRIRSAPDEPWMAFSGEQVNTYGEEPQRVFHLDATMKGLPVQVLHVFDEDHATMRVKLLSFVPVVDAAGPEMDRSETVTLFNDLAVLAPGALVDAPITWAEVDEHTVRGTYTAHGQSVTADLVFDEDGDLVDFVTDDRSRASADGSSFTMQRWNTPLTGYAEVRGHRLALQGSAMWDAPEPEGHFTYIELTVDDLVYAG